MHVTSPSPRKSIERTSMAPASGPLSSRLSVPSRPWPRGAITVGLVSVLFLMQGIPAARLVLMGRDIPLPLAISAANFLLVPILLFVVDRLLVHRFQSVLTRGMLGAVIAALTGGAIGALMWSDVLVIPGVLRRSTSIASPAETIFSCFGMGAVMSVVVVGTWSIAVVFPRVFEHEKIRALQVANLQLETAQLRSQSELAQLRGQLEPHFLLNTLNLISGLVGTDVEKARRTIVNLGDLLRDAVEIHGECHSIDEEIQWLERYTEVLAARHGPTLSFEWDVEARAREACLPRLLLQPLVENAIAHGALRATGPGIITIRVRMPSDERVELSVEDNGPGLTDSSRTGGVGIANVRRRLELISPDASFQLERAIGTRAVLSLPYAVHVPGERKP